MQQCIMVWITTNSGFAHIFFSFFKINTIYLLHDKSRFRYICVAIKRFVISYSSLVVTFLQNALGMLFFPPYFLSEGVPLFAPFGPQGVAQLRALVPRIRGTQI